MSLFYDQRLNVKNRTKYKVSSLKEFSDKKWDKKRYFINNLDNNNWIEWQGMYVKSFILYLND